MLLITERHFLQDLRKTAEGMDIGNFNSAWARAYPALADAADRLDAMQARCELVPPGGQLIDEPTGENVTLVDGDPQGV